MADINGNEPSLSVPSELSGMEPMLAHKDGFSFWRDSTQFRKIEGKWIIVAGMWFDQLCFFSQGNRRVHTYSMHSIHKLCVITYRKVHYIYTFSSEFKFVDVNYDDIDPNIFMGWMCEDGVIPKNLEHL